MEKRQYEHMDPKDLRNHPAQDESFLPLTDDERSQLKQSMTNHGQISPVEITPDGVIIDGHNRVQTAIELKWETVQVWVRPDLDDREAEHRAIDANLERRHIGQLGQLRAEIRKLEIPKRIMPGSLTGQHVGALETLAEIFKMSPKNVSRLWRLVRELPRSLQHAVDQGKLKKGLAAQLCDLESDIRERIAEEVEAGADPNTAAKAHVPAKVNKEPTKRDILLHFGKSVQEVMHVRWRSVRAGLSANEIEELQQLVSSLEEFVPTLRQRLAKALKFEQAENKRSAERTSQVLHAVGQSDLAGRPEPS